MGLLERLVFIFLTPAANHFHAVSSLIYLPIDSWHGSVLCDCCGLHGIEWRVPVILLIIHQNQPGGEKEGRH